MLMRIQQLWHSLQICLNHEGPTADVSAQEIPELSVLQGQNLYNEVFLTNLATSFGNRKCLFM